METPRLVEIPAIGYAEARHGFGPGDAWFYHRKGFRHIRGPHDLGGWISNSVIAGVTKLGGDHRGYHNLIHVEVLAPFTPNGNERWFTMGFTADTNGLRQMLASTAAQRYPEPILWVPLLDTKRGALTAEVIWREAERAGGDRYATASLIDTASKSFRGKEPRRRHFCSGWVVTLYANHAAIPHLEYPVQCGKLYCSPVVGTKWSPKEMLASLCCWDWERARFII